MNISEISSTACTGCLACAYSCPVGCIAINKDDEGFSIPAINIDMCINCGECLRICGAKREFNSSHNSSEVFAARRLDDDALARSSSGGIASLVAEWVLSRHGIVYGAVMDCDMTVKHRRIDSIEYVDSLRGSKYVQSDLSLVYASIKEDCESGRIVALIGTPCQIYGIKQFVNKKYDNLILIDLICHGVPSPELFENYIQWKSNKLGKDRIIEYRFRDKQLYGWDTVYKLSTTSGVETAEATKDPYYFSFIYAQTYRESCYNCRFANLDRIGDVTLGDFWGVEEEHPEYCNKTDLGISAVICNTKKGKKLLEDIADNVTLIKTTIEKVARRNPNLIKAVERPDIRSSFYKQVHDKGFKWADKSMKSDKRYYTEMIKRKISKSIKLKIKKLLKFRG